MVAVAVGAPMAVAVSVAVATGVADEVRPNDGHGGGA
jgi:hypothetical protein